MTRWCGATRTLNLEPALATKWGQTDKNTWFF